MVVASSAMVETLADVLGLNPSTCSNIYRELRTAGLVSNRGRGRNAASMTIGDAANLLLAVCAAERLQDAPDAIRRYTGLEAQNGWRRGGMMVPAPGWGEVEKDFPILAQLPRTHSFGDVLTALVRSYIEADPTPQVHVSIGAPTPWAAVAIDIWTMNYLPHEAASYDEDDVDEDISINEKARERRRFVELGRDLATTNAFSGVTFEALGKLLRVANHVARS